MTAMRPLHNWASQLRQFVQRSERERCDFCGKSIPDQHPHLVDRTTRRFFCACQGCAFSLGQSERFRLVRSRSEVLVGFDLSDAQWNAFHIPIDMVFLFRSSVTGRPVAIYPSPAGPTESQLSLEAWNDLAEANSVLAELEPDVEALLVNRTRGAREYYIVSIDRCYSLVGLIRERWRGLSGGAEAWQAIQEFFASLQAAAAGMPSTDFVHG
jgi:Family of unknown function (DUF5947)